MYQPAIVQFRAGHAVAIGQALGQADGDPKAKANPVLEDQLTESKDGLILLDGKPFSGEVAKYHPNKKKAESYSLKKGKLHGPFITYREDGSPAFQVTFADGIEHGPFKRWFEDGKLWVEENYVAGNSKGSAKPIFRRQTSCSPFIGREKGRTGDWLVRERPATLGGFMRRAG